MVVARIATFCCLCITAAYAASPVFIFGGYRDQTTFPVLERYFQPGDYIQFETVKLDPRLALIADRDHQFQFDRYPKQGPTKTRLGCGQDTAGAVFYQEPTNGSVALIAQRVAAIASSGCQMVAVMPRGELIGAGSTCQDTFSPHILDGLNWSKINFFDIQAEGLLLCTGATAISNYTKFVSAAAAYVRSKNPNIVVAAQLSFRFTPPAIMIQAIQQTQFVVDRFCLSYPLAEDNQYSTSSNLEAVLSAFRKPVR